MPRKCSACESDHLKEIDSLLINNESNRFIATRFNLTPAAVQRHKTNHLPVLLVKAKAAETVAHADKLIDQVQDLLERATRLADQAEKSKNLTAALTGVREIRGVLELIGRINGELQIGGTKVEIAVGSEKWKDGFRDYLDMVVAGDYDDEDEEA
jgi:hypothetical protein